MAEVRTYVKTSGKQGHASIVRVDADRARLNWRDSADSLITSQIMPDDEMRALCEAIALFLEPVPAPAPAPAPATLAVPVLSGTAGDGSVSLSWTLASGAPTRWEVWIDNTYAMQLPGDARSWSKTGLTNGTPLPVRVVAYDDAGYENSNTITLTPTRTTASPAPGEMPAPAGTLVLDEQFGSLDTSRWYAYTSPGNHSRWPGLREPSAVAVRDGILEITAKYDAARRTIVSGAIAHRLDWAHGTVEVRARTDADPTGQMSGVCLRWPRKIGDVEPGPGDGELDFYETTHALDRRLRAFFHYAGALNLQKDVDHGVPATDWHTIRMTCAPDAIRVWRDGVLTGTLTEPDLLERVKRGGHVCLQLDTFGVGGTAGYAPLQTAVQMQVDYVKIWQ